MRRVDKKISISSIPLKQIPEDQDKNTPSFAPKPKPHTHRRVNSHAERSQGLILKDYLRLQSITKKSSSRSHSRRRNSPGNETPEKNKEKSVSDHLDSARQATTVVEETQTPRQLKSIDILKEELDSDIKICLEKMGQLSQNFSKFNPKYENSKQEYDQLVFMCGLHRVIKQSIMGGIDKSHRLLIDHKSEKIFDFVNKANRLINQPQTAARPKKNRYITGTHILGLKKSLDSPNR